MHYVLIFAAAFAALAPLQPHRLQCSHATFIARSAGFDPLANPNLFLGKPLVEQRVLLLFRGESLLFAH